MTGGMARAVGAVLLAAAPLVSPAASAGDPVTIVYTIDTATALATCG